MWSAEGKLTGTAVMCRLGTECGQLGTAVLCRLGTECGQLKES